MSPDNNSIITEDGRRLKIEDGLIAGTNDPEKGLAHETGNVLDENIREDNGNNGACPAPVNRDSKETKSGNASE